MYCGRWQMIVFKSRSLSAKVSSPMLQAVVCGMSELVNNVQFQTMHNMSHLVWHQCRNTGCLLGQSAGKASDLQFEDAIH
jgi:hypothetical protein